jgi:hypothetical protein
LGLKGLVVVVVVVVNISVFELLGVCLGLQHTYVAAAFEFSYVA